MKLNYIIQILVLIFLISFQLISAKPGGVTKVTTGSVEYRRALKLLKRSGVNLKESRIEVNAIYQQIVSGTLYTYRCEVRRRGQTRPCVIKLLDQPWMTPKTQSTKNTCQK